ncbi:MLO-like protein 4 isoform X2 [Macadamia integrifolia]|uniref:MLO-like protein 4 isoform X2 n=1 Tax=Macadamia integrifolia TaxID=60698 RepID=UPI001C4F9860|nr:MLO-like protein 4 isoform X2 [Macadamia integrifolia]
MAESVETGRSLAETPTWSVASVTTVMVVGCFLVERSVYRLGKWLQRTRRKALLASLEKIKEELMLLGLISLMLGQWARWISRICVDSKLFNSRFFLCSEEDYLNIEIINAYSSSNLTDFPPREIDNTSSSNQCGEGREPFVSYEGLEQLHLFLFVLGITHVLYSCVTVGLAMVKIYSWRTWENHARSVPEGNLQAIRNKVMRRQTTFVFHHTSHPWSRSRVLIWMLCFLRQFKSSIEKSDYMALRLGFINNHNLPLSYDFHKYMVRSMDDEFHGIVGISWPLWGYAILSIFINIHGLNIYFWLSFIPAILVMLVGTKLQHVVSLLALEISESTDPAATAQVKPHDDLFWFGKPDILLWLIHFISFQNAFEMASFIWSLWGFQQRSCFMKNHVMIVIRLASGLLVQLWCSSCTVPLNVIVTQMGSKFKKALIAEGVRESLHSWCKRVKERSKHSHPGMARSTCSLDSTYEERDEIIAVGSGTLSHSTSAASLNQEITECAEKQATVEILDDPQFDHPSRVYAYSSESPSEISFQLPTDSPEQIAANEGCNATTLVDLFQRT